MKWNVFYFGLLSIMLLLYVNAIKSQKIHTIRIDPRKTYGGNISTYFDSVKYIPLETTSESLFGDVSKLIVTDSAFIISDNDTHSILFFSREGRYLRKLSFQQNDFPEMEFIQSENSLLLFNYDRNIQNLKWRICAIDGRNLRPWKVIPNILGSVIPLENGYYGIVGYSCYYPSSGYKVQDTNYYLVNIYKGDSLYKSMFPINQKAQCAFCALAGNVTASPNPISGKAFISLPLYNKAYELTKDTIIEKYRFVFPIEWTYSASILENTNKKFIDSMRLVMTNDPKRIFQVSNIYQTQHYLFFKIARKAIYNQKIDLTNPNSIFNFVYDFDKNVTLSLERLISDSITVFLPIFSNNIKTIKEGLVYQKNYVYSNVSSAQMFAARDATKSKHPKYPPSLQEYFSRQNRKANPVIVRMRLKE